jgi:hypothetical protein
MRIIDAEQGSPEWRKARVGIPTASCFDQIVTPKKGELSKSAGKYLARLVAEWFYGEPFDNGETAFMERGTGLEGEAADWYSLVYDADLEQFGLCLRDDIDAGCSPDRLVRASSGIVEIKCPAAVTQVGYLLNGAPDDYRCQIQGQLWITERDWVDLCCWHPTLPKVVKRFGREEAFIETMGDAVAQFCDDLARAKETLADEKAAYDASKAAVVDEELPAELSV